MDYKKVFYPLEEAVTKAALQNLTIDLRKGLITQEGFDNSQAAGTELYDLYEQEAREVITTTGENYLPEGKFTEHICLEKN